MSSLHSIRKSIHDTFLTAWGNKIVFFDNEFGTPPDGSEPWAMLSFFSSKGDQITLASADSKVMFQRNGLFSLQIFVSFGSGTKVLDNLIEKIKNVFESRRASTINYSNIDIRSLGVRGDWYQTNININYEYTELK